MKNLFPFLVLAGLLYACQTPATAPRAVGFTNWSDDGKAYQFHLGTETSLAVLKAFDKASQEKDYQAIREIMSDTVKITYHNGQSATADEFINMNKRRDSMLEADGETLNWKLQSAYAVDLDPSRGGELVDAMYLASYDGKEEAYQFYANLKMYIVNGKIITVNQYNQSIVSDE